MNPDHTFDNESFGRASTTPNSTGEVSSATLTVDPDDSSSGSGADVVDVDVAKGRGPAKGPGGKEGRPGENSEIPVAILDRRGPLGSYEFKVKEPGTENVRWYTRGKFKDKKWFRLVNNYSRHLTRLAKKAVAAPDEDDGGPVAKSKRTTRSCARFRQSKDTLQKDAAGESGSEPDMHPVEFLNTEQAADSAAETAKESRDVPSKKRKSGKQFSTETRRVESKKKRALRKESDDDDRFESDDDDQFELSSCNDPPAASVALPVVSTVATPLYLAGGSPLSCTSCDSPGPSHELAPEPAVDLAGDLQAEGTEASQPNEAAIPTRKFKKRNRIPAKEAARKTCYNCLHKGHCRGTCPFPDPYPVGVERPPPACLQPPATKLDAAQVDKWAVDARQRAGTLDAAPTALTQTIDNYSSLSRTICRSRLTSIVATLEKEPQGALGNLRRLLNTRKVMVEDWELSGASSALSRWFCDPCADGLEPMRLFLREFLLVGVDQVRTLTPLTVLVDLLLTSLPPLRDVGMPLKPKRSRAEAGVEASADDSEGDNQSGVGGNLLANGDTVDEWLERAFSSTDPTEAYAAGSLGIVTLMLLSTLDAVNRHWSHLVPNLGSSPLIPPQWFVHSGMTRRVEALLPRQGREVVALNEWPPQVQLLASRFKFLLPFQTRVGVYYCASFSGDSTDAPCEAPSEPRKVTKKNVFSIVKHTLRNEGSQTPPIEFVMERVGEEAAQLDRPATQACLKLVCQKLCDQSELWVKAGANSKGGNVELFPAPLPSDEKSKANVKSTLHFVGRLIGRAIQDRRFLALPFRVDFYFWLLGRENWLAAGDVERVRASGSEISMKAVRKGFNAMAASQHLARYCHPREIWQLLCGLSEAPGVAAEEWSATNLRANWHFDVDDERKAEVTERLIRLVSGYGRNERQRLLRFVTGWVRLPPGGFASLIPRWTVKEVSIVDAEHATAQGPRATRNCLVLPRYSDELALAERMLQALADYGRQSSS